MYKFSSLLQFALTISLVCLFDFSLWAQKNEGVEYVPNFKYEPQQLQSDFIILRWVLEKAHPGLYWYTPKIILDRKMDSTLALLNHPMDEAEFYQTISPVIANIHCGHTILDPSYRYQDFGKRFPLDLKFEEGRAYILRNHSEDSSIVLGSEVLSINGLSISSILQKMLPCLAADGLHNQGKWDALESDFQNYYDLLVEKPEKFELECIDFKTKEKIKYQIPAMDSDFLRTYDKQYSKDMETRRALEFDIMDSISTGVLTINSFLPIDIKFSKQKFSKFIKKTFQTLNSQNTENLIIDLRNNNGGEMLYANELFSYLIDKPYKFLDRVQVTSNQKLSQLRFTELAKTSIHNPRRVSLVDSAYVVKSNYYRFLETQKPKKNNFQGNVYVLIDKRTFSAATLFSALVYAYKRGKFIGEETSGGANGLNGGDFVDMVLPNTNLLLEVPIEKWVKNIPAYPHRNKGIVPHYPIRNTIEDELNHKDRVMEFTLDLLQKNKANK